jgi:transposase-like protein
MKKSHKTNVISPEQKYTINDFNAEFPTDSACLMHIFFARWPNGRTMCEKCGVERKHYRVKGRTAFACDHCGNHIYPLASTIFEKSTTSLRLWFHAMFLVGSTRCGVSAKQIQRQTGVTYKTAWRMFKQIRTLMSGDISLEGSSVEMDETYVGGRRRGWRGRARVDDPQKTCVVGAVERRGRVRAMVSTDARRKTLHGIAREYILPESTVYTDEFTGYDGLDAHGYQHRRINHSQGVYVLGDTHTNTIDGFWSLAKRGIGGVYHSVSKKYLQTYLDEYSYRYNRRTAGKPMFTSLLAEVSERASQ